MSFSCDEVSRQLKDSIQRSQRLLKIRRKNIRFSGLDDDSQHNPALQADISQLTRQAKLRFQYSSTGSATKLWFCAPNPYVVRINAQDRMSASSTRGRSERNDESVLIYKLMRLYLSTYDSVYILESKL